MKITVDTTLFWRTHTFNIATPDPEIGAECELDWWLREQLGLKQSPRRVRLTIETLDDSDTGGAIDSNEAQRNRVIDADSNAGSTGVA